jgi:hypothetical protein
MHYKYMSLKKSLIIVSLLLVPLASLAESTPTTPTTSPMLNRLKAVGTGAGYGAATDTTAIEIIGMVINGALVLLGTVFIILMLLAGYNWMTAHGDQEKITKAQHTIKAAIIGLIIVIGAFAIWRFISDYLIVGPGGGNPSNL